MLKFEKEVGLEYATMNKTGKLPAVYIKDGFVTE